MDKPKSNIDFRLMSFTYKLRDLFLPRINILREAGIRLGFHVLDYGCGPGSYILPLTELVGKSGRIYAVDINPLAVQAVKKLISKRGFSNVEVIHSDCKTGVPEESIDVVLLYDVFHDLSDPAGVLKELHRVLKPNGILSFTDHHLKEEEIISGMTSGRLFRLSAKGARTCTFSKEEP
ncbi:MAG: class I SAM-dependent methyltransferase [Chloroflexi bacterium]|nr:class I SAM-dependent methyltransferase [Chloroflexota bacterium]